jgi:hypothetical protein
LISTLDNRDLFPDSGGYLAEQIRQSSRWFIAVDPTGRSLDNPLVGSRPALQYGPSRAPDSCVGGSPAEHRR